jgi:succinate dehydrogenase / fumarate reductase cytochrome b subunit
MSNATVAGVGPGRPRRKSLGVFDSSIGLKLVMAGTGVIMSGFVLVHMLGNLKTFEGAEALDAYAKLLRIEPPLLWAFRFTLLGAVGAHIWAWLKLTRANLGARKSRYRVHARKESTWASRSMAFTGPILLAFIVFHLLHLTTGTVHPKFEEGKVYQNLITGLSVVPVGLFYLLGLGALAFHLWHGIWSVFQTLGSAQPRYGSLGRKVATVFTVLVVGGFATVPIAVLAGLVK